MIGRGTQKLENHWSTWCRCQHYHSKCFKNKAKDL